MNYVIWLLVAFILLILFFLILPWNIKTKIKYDVLKNNGKLELKLYKLLVFRFNFSIEQRYIELNSVKSNKTILLPIVFQKKQSGSKVIKQLDFITILLKKIKLEQGTVYINFGAQTDCFLSAMIVGFMRVIFSILASFIKTKKHNSRIKNKIYPSFNKDNFIFCFKGSIKLSVMQILLAKIQASFASTKYYKEIMQYE